MIMNLLYKPNLSSLLRIYLVMALQVCMAKVTVGPAHVIAHVGTRAEYSCSSDVIGYPADWAYSKSLTHKNGMTYNGAFRAKFHNRLNMENHVKDNIRESTLVITNVSMLDSGFLHCADDGGFGIAVAAKLSVADNISCSAACVNDRLLVSCSTCYLGPDKLDLYLQYNGPVKADKSSETYDDQRKCNEMEAFWAVKAVCQALDETKLSVTLKENTTSAYLKSDDFGVLVDRIWMTTIPNEVGIIATKKNVPESSDVDTKFTTKITMAIGYVGFAICVAIIIALWAIYFRKCSARNNRKNSPRSNEVVEDLLRHKNFCLPLSNASSSSSDDGSESGLVSDKPKGGDPNV